jgi:hypothetical protein
MTGGRLYRCLALLALAALFSAAQGCGSSNDSTTPESDASTTQLDPSDAISEAEIERYETGAPQQVALQWWRAVQLNEAELARTLYAEPPSLPDLAGQFNFVAGQLVGPVEIASVKRKGDQAIVAIDWDKPGAPPRQVTLQMEHRHGEWKIVSTLFLDLIVQRLQLRSEAADAAKPSG